MSERKIHALYDRDQSSICMVGVSDVTEIREIERNGEMASVRWFEVYAGEFLWKEVNAAHVGQVVYIKSDTEMKW